MLAVILCSVLSFAISVSDTLVTVSGIIVDINDRSVVPFAVVRFGNAGSGTVTAADGSFRFRSYPGECPLRIHHLAYEPTSLLLNLRVDTVLTIFLTPKAFSVAEVVVRGEDPGRAIMSAAIDRIRIFKEERKTYFARVTAKSTLHLNHRLGALFAGGMDIAGGVNERRRVLSQWSKSWRSPDSTFSDFSSSEWIDLTADTCVWWQNRFPGVLSRAALEHYAFVLDSTISLGGKEMRYLTARIHSRLEPGLEGTIIVDDEDRVRSVHLVANDAFASFSRMIILDSASLECRYGSEPGRWLPDFYQMTSEFHPPVPGESTVLRVESLVSIDEKEYGAPLGREDPLQVETSAERQAHPAIDTVDLTRVPLTAIEREILVSMDTTNRVRSWREREHLAEQHRSSSVPSSLLRYGIVRFTDITGLALGFQYPLTPGRFGILPALVYGFADRRIQWKLIGGYALSSDRQTRVQATVFQGLSTNNDNPPYPLDGMLGAALIGESTRDYVRSSGWSIGLVRSPDIGDTHFQWQILYRQEEQSTAIPSTRFMMFSSDRPRRHPLVIPERRRQSLLASFHSGHWSVEASASGASPGEQIERSFQWNIIHTDMLVLENAASTVSPVLCWNIHIAGSRGRVPASLLHSPETRVWFYALPYHFRALAPKEFAGDQLYVLQAEWNLRSTPFLVLGLTGARRAGLEIALFAGILRSNHNSVTQLPEDGFRQSTNGWYIEGGIGCAGILSMFRADITRRFTHHPRTVLTVRIDFPQ